MSIFSAHSNRLALALGLAITFTISACDSDDPAPSAVALLGDATFPEGIAAHADTGALFVGGFASGEIQRIEFGQASYFKTAGQDGLMNVVGLAVDNLRDRLWVTNTNIADATAPQELVVFDTADGTLLARFVTASDGLPRLFNDVTVDAAGNAYVTDSLGHAVWTVDSQLNEMRVLAADPGFELVTGVPNLNGIVVTPDQRYMIATVGNLERGALFRIAIADGSVTEIATPNDFLGFDGMDFLPDGRLVGISPGLYPLQLVSFDSDYATATKAVDTVAIRDYSERLDFPTTLAVLDNRVWIVNSQLDHLFQLDPNADPAGPPELPFEIVAVPADEL